MFKNLTNLSYERSLKEAIGFYIVCFIFLLAIAIVFGIVIGIILHIPQLGTDPLKYDRWVDFGSLLSTMTVAAISFLITKEKNLLPRFDLLLIILASGILTFFLGGLIGLLPTAYLTTRKIEKKSKNQI